MFRSIVAALIGGMLLYLAVPQIGPALSAARADGAPGTFTAKRLECVQHPGHRDCRWTGSFEPGNGGPPRFEVTLYGVDAGVLRAGMRTEAMDTGRANRVYGPGGSSEWILTSALLLAGCAIIYLGIAHPLVRRRGRPRAPEEAPLSAQSAE